MASQEMKIEFGAWSETFDDAKFMTQSDEIVYCVNEAGKVQVRKGDEVGQIEHGKLHTLSVCKGVVVGTNDDQNVYRLDGATPENLEAIQGGTWTQLGHDNKLKNVSVGPDGQLWGVNNNDEVWYSPTPQATFQHVPGGLTQICCDPRTRQVVGVNDRDGSVWLRTGISAQNTMGADWEQLPFSFTFVSSCNNNLIGVARNGHVWFMEAGLSINMQGSGLLMRVPGVLFQKVMLTPGGYMVGVTLDGKGAESRVFGIDV